MAGTNLKGSAFPGTTITPVLIDESGLVLQAVCTGVPSDSTAGRYSPGAMIQRTDASSQSPLYFMNGTTAAPTFSSSSSEVTVTLTSAQILGLFGSPVLLVPAQGVGIATIVTGIFASLTFGTAAYVGANNLEFRYRNGSGAKVTADMPSSFLDSASSALQYAPAVTAALAPLTNSPIIVDVPVANPTAGDSTIAITVRYYTVKA